MSSSGKLPIDVDELRAAIMEEYEAVACHPQRGYHFHTGRRLAGILGYEDAWLEKVPESSIESFAGTGNPFSMGALRSGERVVDVGCGAGIDTFIAADMVAPHGRAIGVDMTQAMLDKAAASVAESGLTNVEFRSGYGEELPVESGWADVVISNGALNLMPDKPAALAEIARVLKPTGRLQFGDILVQKPVSDGAKAKIDLWTG